MELLARIPSGFLLQRPHLSLRQRCASVAAVHAAWRSACVSVLASSLALGQSLGEGPHAAQSKANLDLPYEAKSRLEFYGEGFEGDGVVFVVDRSGSMQDSGELDIAKQEVARNITELSAQVEFAVVFFDANVMKWPSGGGPVQAKASQKASAIQWVLGIPGGSGSCVQQGMAAGVDFANKTTVERPVILYVGDGGGTCRGAPELTYLKATLASVASLSFRMARINTVGVLDIPRANADFLKALAAANHGMFVKIFR